MRACALCLLALLCLAPPGVAQDKPGAKPETYTNGPHGFAVTRPPADWAFSEPTPPGTAKYAAKFALVQDAKETSLLVYVLKQGELKDASAARDAVEGTWKNEPKLSNIRKGNSTFDKRVVPFLRGDYDAGAKYALRQHYFVGNSRVYIVQCLAPVEAFAGREKEFDALVASFRAVDIDDSPSPLQQLADRCGSEIKWAASWKEASTRAARENKLIVVVFEVYRGIVGKRFTPYSTFMDEDVVALINERCVGLYWSDATDAPFDDPKVYGLGPGTFGQGTLFADARGNVLGQAVSFQPHYYYSRLCEILASHPGAPAKDPKDAALLLRRGEHDKAAALLAQPQTADQWLLKADLHRRTRQVDPAREALSQAAAQGAPVALPRARLHLNAGQWAEADRALLDAPGPEAAWWRTLAVGWQKGLEAIAPALQKLCDEHPGSRWAWRAAALLLKLAALDPRWPEPARLEAANQSEFETAKDAKVAAGRAVAFLLASQQPDGCWFSPMALGSDSTTAAITALCGEALLPLRERDDVRKAVDAALRYVLAAKLETNPDKVFDYTIWGQIFVLRFLARCRLADVGDNAALGAALQRLVDAMAQGRHASGGWAYVRIAGHDDNPIGFVTAAALLALREAQGAGANVPADMFSKAAAVLERLHNPNGSFGYMWASGIGEDKRVAEASLRSPLYAYALMREKRAEGATLRKALDVYLKHHEHTRKERGKGLCHTGQEGTASYYLLFGYQFAAEALAFVPEKDRAPFRKALVEDVLSLHCADGSFTDNAMIGRTYGAAMAVQTLRLLE